MGTIEEVKTSTKAFLSDRDASISQVHRMSLPRKDCRCRSQAWETTICPRRNWAWSTRAEHITKNQAPGQTKVTLTEQPLLELVPFTLRDNQAPNSNKIRPIDISSTKTEWCITKESTTASMGSSNKWTSLRRVSCKLIILVSKEEVKMDIQWSKKLDLKLNIRRDLWSPNPQVSRQCRSDSRSSRKSLTARRTRFSSSEILQRAWRTRKSSTSRLRTTNRYQTTRCPQPSLESKLLV